MPWNEPLGNPFDDVRFLQTTERHRGESVIKTRRELHIAGVLQTNKAKEEINEWFNLLKKEIHIPEGLKEHFEDTVTEAYKLLADNHFTYYGKKTIKNEVMAFLTFNLAPNEIFPQIDDNLNVEDCRTLNKAHEIIFRKAAKKHGCPFSLLPFDKHSFEAQFDYVKICQLFKEGTDKKTIKRLWYDEGTSELLKMLDKLSSKAKERYDKGINKGINFDWLYMLSHIHTIKKKGYKILKNDKEIASILGIPYDTHRKKATFLYSLG